VLLKANKKGEAKKGGRHGYLYIVKTPLESRKKCQKWQAPQYRTDPPKADQQVQYHLTREP